MLEQALKLEVKTVESREGSNGYGREAHYPSSSKTSDPGLGQSMLG